MSRRSKGGRVVGAGARKQSRSSQRQSDCIFHNFLEQVLPARNEMKEFREKVDTAEGEERAPPMRRKVEN
jgi:hypothetical protein